jgi:transglutaminase-like putative cysteine protease
VTGKSNSAWTILVLIALGIGFLIARLNLRFEAGESDYRLTYTAEVNARKPAEAIAPDIHLLAAFPETTRFCRVLEQDVAATGLEQVRTRVQTAERRKDLVLRATNTGQLTCSISFRLQLDRKGDWRQSTVEAPLDAHQRATYLGNSRFMTANSATAQEMVSRLRDNHPAPQELADRIFRYCIAKIEPVGELGSNSGDEVLLHQKGSPLGRARAFAALCRAAKIPARLVTGFEIKKGDNVQPRTWVEAYLADPRKPAVERWVPYDPENGSLHELDYNFVPVRRDGVELIRVTAGSDLAPPSYSIESIPPAPRTLLGIFDLRSLPGKLHEPIKVVLILPIGALFTALMRTIIGFRTFGTFSPTLLALAFVYNDWRSGLCIFFVVLATGFVSRTFLDRLKLLMVPRLGIILTMVVMLMVLSISAMNYFKSYFDWAPGGQTVLLPMVILTNLVERFYVTSEEDSILEALRLLTGSVLMALAIYFLLSWPSLGDLLFWYPELHFFTVAALVLMGRYTGYRLTELVRFRDLVHPRGSED